MRNYSDDIREILDYSSASLLASYQPQILDRRQAAEKLGISYSRLAHVSADGGGPPFHRIGPRGRAKYLRVDLDAWIAERKENR